jgi:NADH:ubiquinone oxidoreductase subunit K
VGQVFALFVIAVAAWGAARAHLYRNKETINIDEMNLMRW